MISTSFISRRSQENEQNTKSFDAYRLGHTLTQKPSAPLTDFFKPPLGGGVAHTGFGESGDFEPPDLENPVGFRAECLIMGATQRR